MSSVQIFHVSEDNDVSLAGVIDGDRIKAHSGLIRDIIATRELALIYEIEVTGPTLEGLSFVIDQINQLRKGQVLKVRVHDLPVEKVVAVHRAVHHLKIEPKQGHIRGHLNWYLSRCLVTLSEMKAVYDEFSFHAKGTEGQKIYDVMINTLSWQLAEKELTGPKADAYWAAMESYLDLKRVVVGLTKSLEKRKEKREQAQAQGE